METVHNLMENNSLEYEPNLKHVLNDFKQHSRKSLQHTMGIKGSRFKKTFWVNEDTQITHSWIINLF